MTFREHNYHGIYGSEVNKGKDYSAYKTMIEVLLGERRRRNR